jgi:ChrR Cupin-like domain
MSQSSDLEQAYFDSTDTQVELMMLHALDALDGEDQALFEAALLETPSLLNDAFDWATLASTLAYATPLETPTTDLKMRMCDRITQIAHLERSSLYPQLSLSLDVLRQKATELVWEPLPGGSMPSEIAVWQTDTEHRQVSFFVRTAVAGDFPRHWHAEGEEVLVLEGDFVVDGRPYGPGERIFSAAQTAHQPSTTQGTLVFCLSSMDDEFTP